MKYLIIYAHPKKLGHCSTILDEVRLNLKKNKAVYDIIDLYGVKYDPVMHENEHYTSGGYNISKQNQSYQSMIKKANRLIFIYPLWWMSVPAILKGFFDKVLTPKFAFNYERGIPQGLLKGKKAAIIVSSGGSKIMYRLMFNIPHLIIKYGVLRFCGIKSKVFQVDKATKLDSKQVVKINKVVLKALKYLKK
jgi:NAD(P)H dehydrogenase (quinone)